MYTNAQILAAILNRFAQPVIQTFANSKLQSIPFIKSIENKVRSTGWVSGSWSMAGELAPFVEPITGTVVQPLLNHYLSQLPDETIPTMIHNIVDTALEKGELSFFEGYICFEKSELQELKRLLNINLPAAKVEAGYIVKTEGEEIETNETETEE